MLDLMRKHHKVAMLVTAIIVVMSMAFWGNNQRDTGTGFNREILGKHYDLTDLKSVGAELQMAQSVTSFQDAPGKLFFLLQNPGTNRKMDGKAAPDTALINQITLREEAWNLGISVSDSEVEKAIQGLKRLQTEGKFDRAKLDALFGSDPVMGQKAFLAMMRDGLLAEKLQKLVGGTMPATDYAVNLAYNKEHAKTTVHLVTLPRKEHEDLKATEEDAQKFYDANKDKPVAELDAVLRSEPSRDFKYIKIDRAKRTEDISKLTPEEQTAKKKEWDDADRKASVTASAIDNAMVAEKPATIEEAVAALTDKPDYLPVEIKSVSKVIASAPPEDLKSEAALLGEMMDEGTGVKKTSTGFLIYDSGELEKSRLLTFEEAKAKLIEKLTKEKISAALLDKATGVRSKLQEALTANKPFTEALMDARVTAISYTYTSKAPPKDAPPYFPAVQAAVASLAANSLAANPVPAGEDMAVVFLEKIELPDDPKMTDDKAILKRNNGITDSPFAASPLFTSWFSQRREVVAPVFGEAQ